MNFSAVDSIKMITMQTAAQLLAIGACADRAHIENDDEARWVARAKSGDEAAFRWLLSRYRERAVRVASRVLLSPADGEDAAQEAFITAFRKVHQFGGGARFYTWFYRILINICLEQKRSPRWQSEAEFDNPHVSAPPDATVTRMTIEKLLAELPSESRATIVLREMEGLDYEEIAQVLQIPTGTVRSRLNKARERFRQLWSEMESEAAMFDDLMRQGLFEMRDPKLTPEFDDAIIAAICKPQPKWKVWLLGARPAIAAGCCSALAIAVLASLPTSTPVYSASNEPVSLAVQRALEDPDSVRGTFARLIILSNARTKAAPAATPAPRRRESEERSQHYFVDR